MGAALRLIKIWHFYPRPPRGGRRGWLSVRSSITRISIHALREEGDASCRPTSLWRPRFLSTPSARRATFLVRYTFIVFIISIHALREEGDAH